MADETTQFIVGDVAADALGERRKRRFFGRRRKSQERERLTHCENCGAALAGEYCAQCGQHAIDYRRSIWRVAIDALDSFLNWDTKFLKSAGILLTRPGKLTNDFNAGRRVRYVHPLRLYLLASIAFFLIAKLVNVAPGTDIKLDAEDRAEVQAALAQLTAPDSPLTPEQRSRIEAARALWAGEATSGDEKKRAKLDDAMLRLQGLAEKKEFKPKDVEKLDATLARIDAVNANREEPPAVEGSSPAAAPPGPEQARALPSPSVIPKRNFGPVIQFDADDDKKPKDPFEQWLETRIKDKIGEGGTKAQLFLETLRSHIPTMMLACVPLFAFVLKLLYIRQRRYYVEHLVYSLHIHTFAYVAVVVITLVAMAAQRLVPNVQELLIFLLSLVAVVQVFLSIRRVYRQGWFMTMFKFLLGGAAYFVVLVFAVAVTAFITLVLP